MRKLVAILCMLFIASGCVPTREIEQLGIINTYGADYADEEKKTLNNTLLYTQFDPQSQKPFETVEAKANSYQEAVSAANLKTSYKLVTGHIRMKIFGKEVAKAGIMRLLSTHFRDAIEPANLHLAVSEKTANEVLNSKGAVDIGKYLYELIENNIQAEVIPESKFYTFAHKYDDVGVDPILPVITLEKDRPAVDSIGLFQNDRYVDKISPDETFLVKLLIERFRAGKREIALPREPFEDSIAEDTDKHYKEDIFVILSEIKSKSNIKLINSNVPEYEVKVKFNGRMMEVSEPLKVDDNKILTKLEKHISEHFEDQLNQLLKKFQEINVDPIGFGALYDAETRNKQLTEQQWRDMFPNIKVNFNVDVNIIRHGVIE